MICSLQLVHQPCSFSFFAAVLPRMHPWVRPPLAAAMIIPLSLGFAGSAVRSPHIGKKLVKGLKARAWIV